jgi:hypothetical protein
MISALMSPLLALAGMGQKQPQVTNPALGPDFYGQPAFDLQSPVPEPQFQPNPHAQYANVQIPEQVPTVDPTMAATIQNIDRLMNQPEVPQNAPFEQTPVPQPEAQVPQEQEGFWDWLPQAGPADISGVMQTQPNDLQQMLDNFQTSELPEYRKREALGRASKQERMERVYSDPYNESNFQTPTERQATNLSEGASFEESTDRPLFEYLQQEHPIKTNLSLLGLGALASRRGRSGAEAFEQGIQGLKNVRSLWKGRTSPLSKEEGKTIGSAARGARKNLKEAYSKGERAPAYGSQVKQLDNIIANSRGTANPNKPLNPDSLVSRMAAPGMPRRIAGLTLTAPAVGMLLDPFQQAKTPGEENPEAPVDTMTEQERIDSHAAPRDVGPLPEEPSAESDLNQQLLDLIESNKYKGTLKDLFGGQYGTETGIMTDVSELGKRMVDTFGPTHDPERNPMQDYGMNLSAMTAMTPAEEYALRMQIQRELLNAEIGAQNEGTIQLLQRMRELGLGTQQPQQ